MRSIRVTFENNDFLETNINGTDEEIRNYYVGKYFELKENLIVKAIKVEFLDD